MAGERIDVLATLDFAAARARGEGLYGTASDVARAATAVADLIGFVRKVSGGPLDGCGCRPVCRCLEPDALREWARSVEDEARTTLARIGGQP